MEQPEPRPVRDFADVGPLDYASGHPRPARVGAAEIQHWIAAGALICPALAFLIRAFAGPGAAVAILFLVGFLLLGCTALAIAIGWLFRTPVRALVRTFTWAIVVNVVSIALIDFFIPFGRPL